MLRLILATTTDDLPSVEITDYADPVELVRYVRDVCDPDGDDMWGVLAHLTPGATITVSQDMIPVAVIVRLA